MHLIALTGGIASGKSTIGRRLEELGAVRIDADQLARDAVAPGSTGLARVVESFGSEVLREDGSLNRERLGAIVFTDAEALARLNAIVHPEVRRLAAESIEAAERANPDAIVVYEIPLLVEAGGVGGWDTVVVAEAPAEVRTERMVKLRGLTHADAARRIAHQASDDERRAIADVVIDTSGTEAETIQQVDELWERLRELA